MFAYMHRGIGLAVTKILLEEFNAIVVTISRTTTPELRALHDRFNLSTHSVAEKTENPLQIIECDVLVSLSSWLCCFNYGRRTDGLGLSRAINEYNRIDGLILNAGTLDPLGNIDSPDITVDSWKRHFDVNFFSLVGALKVAIPALRKSQPGRIVFVSSGAAEGGTAAWGYALSYNAFLVNNHRTGTPFQSV
jgi:NAD(P)-dependent dehydrogenase (short-subunit alcohol dehydrogenase family)